MSIVSTMITINRTNKPSTFWYTHVLYFMHVCHDGEWHVIRVCLSYTHVYTWSDATHAVMFIFVSCVWVCVIRVWGVCYTHDTRGPFKFWVIFTVLELAGLKVKIELTLFSSSFQVV